MDFRPLWDTWVKEIALTSLLLFRRNEERSENSEERRRETRRRVGSNAYTAGGTRRREVLLSGRGPLSSRWWQVSVAALVAENGRRFSPETSLLLAISHARVRNKGTRALHERQKCVRWRRRQATRTMRHATPGVKPPPRSDATATRYAPYTRCYERARETRFRSGYARSRRNYRAGNPARESSRHAVKPCLLHLVVDRLLYILFILL